MPNKYFRAISAIKASDELKEKIKLNLERNNLPKTNKTKGEIIIKIKKGLIAIASTLATLVCGGAVYAALGGTISGIPVVEWLGIKFSGNYTQYEERVQNQYVENDFAKITLDSTVCDDGFTILKFNVKLKDNIKEKIKELTNISPDSEEFEDVYLKYYLSFNDNLPNADDEIRDYSSINGRNNNLIIDGEKYFVNGSIQSIEEIIANNEYTIYQMWFLTDDELENKETFTITLNNIAIEVNGEYIKFDNNLNIQLSKTKAKENTQTIKSDNETISYKKMTKAIEEVKITPLQYIVKLSTTIKDASNDSLAYLLDENYVGEIRYRVYDQNGDELSSYNVETKKEIIYEDGTKEELKAGSEFSYYPEFKNTIVNSTEYIAIENSENITELTIKIYETNEYYSVTNEIGTFRMSLIN